ncbi:MAG: ABC transporter ATP-binding protein [Oscillospiraceae bacterium]|nr:ABC transporter ATP-binding protein [Oscillospiraceae bacterium]
MSINEREIILEARNVTKVFRTSKGRPLLANDSVNLTVRRGETLGIAGESGCGKSTFIRMATMLDPPTSGQILFRGQDVSGLRGEKLRAARRHVQMVFQDPGEAFSPRMKVKNIICEPLRNFGLISRSQVRKKAEELLAMVELPPEYAERYARDMSGGQRQRVGIARALALEPELLVCDEVTSALDVSVQKRIVDLLLKLQREKNITMIFICHDIALVRAFAHRTAIMYLGNVVEIVPGRQLGISPCHPYTEALRNALFDLDMDFSKPIEAIESEAPSPLDVPPGCPFSGRCGHCSDRCRTEKPALRDIAPGHQVACHLFD